MTRHPRLRPVVLVSVVLAVVAHPVPAAAQPRLAAVQPAPVQRCVVTDDRLAELSGLAADAEHWYAVSDGGRRLQVAVLRKDCSLQRMITAAVDPFDVEDLALAADGRLWLADVGDNSRSRATIAVHVLPPQGAPALHRLTYPDGPHDAEALVLDRQDRPYVITKELLGGPGVYRPTGPLAGPGPTPLERVATVRLPRSATPGGPTRTRGATLITGAATTADGAVLALRTYTDAFLFPVRDGDLVAAFAGEPVQVPLPDEPQGEAVAFEPDGTLLSGSERATAGPQPIRAVPDAAALAQPAPAEPPASSPPTSPPTASTQDGQAGEAAAQHSPEGGDRSPPDWQVFLVAVLAAAAVVVVISRVGRRAG